MVGLAENIQACLRIFRRAQHQWLVRDICIKRKGFLLFLSYDTDRGSRVQKVLIRLIRPIRGKEEKEDSCRPTCR